MSRSFANPSRSYSVVLAVVGVAACCGARPAFGGELEFTRDVLPILSSNCFACHGPDAASRQAELRFDERKSAVDLGAIVPGKPDDSELIRRINSSEDEERAQSVDPNDISRCAIALP